MSPAAQADAMLSTTNQPMVAWTPDVNMGQPEGVDLDKHINQLSPTEWLQYAQSQKPSAQPVDMAAMQKQSLSNNWRHVQGMIFDKDQSEVQWVNWPSSGVTP